MKEKILKVEGMMCSGCENRIEKALMNQAGIETVKADHTKGTVLISAKEEMDYVADQITRIVERLRNMSPLYEDFIKHNK